MKSMQTLFVVATAVLTVGFFLFVGYAIALKEPGPALWGLGLLALAGAAAWVVRRAPTAERGRATD